MGELEERRVVTCFLKSGDEILILRRSQNVGTYHDKWAGVSGYIEQSADEQVLVEIEEETALDRKEVVLIKKGAPLTVNDDKLGIRWVVLPYLFQIEDRAKIKIDWEHKEARWIKPAELANYQTVPMLNETLRRVMEEEN